jgi:hypothetical protein
MDALAEVYANYNFSVYEQEKESILDEGIENVLLRLRRYMKNPDKYALKSLQALKEIEAVLERFYYQDSKFSKQLYAKALRHVKRQTASLSQGVT